MKLDHINLCTTDVYYLVDFLIKHFDYSTLQAGKVPAAAPGTGGTDFVMLEGSDGSSLVITQIVDASEPVYPKEFHFGIKMDSPDEVRAKHEELQKHGRKPEKINEFDAVGSKWTTFYCPLCDGMKIEVNHRMPSPTN